MSHGGDGFNELAVAKIQLRAAADTLSGSGGLHRLQVANRSEMAERSMGAFAALLIMAAFLPLATSFAVYVAPVCIALALGGGAYALYSGRRLANLRENQLRAVAEQHLQEKNNA